MSTSNLTTSILPKLTDSPLRVENIHQVIKVYDPIRKQFIKLDPEEYVRQQVISFLINNGIPESRIAVEKQLIGSQKRFDIIVCDSSFKPKMLVECKAETVTIQNQTIQQIAHYNTFLNCPCTLITNGSYNLVTAVHHIQSWNELITFLTN